MDQPPIDLEKELQPKNPEEVRLDAARQKYADAYKAFLAERKADSRLYTKAWRFLNGSNVPEEEIPPYLKQIETEYDSAIVAFGGTMFDEKRRELESSTLTEEEREEELKKFKQKEVFNRVIVQEHEELNKLQVENLPPKEKGVVRKSLEWYMGLKPAWKKVAISSLLSTGAIVLFSSGAVVMTASTVAGIAGGRIARAAVGSFVGQGVSKAYDYFFKDHSAEERVAAEKELSEVFESNDALGMSFKETQKNYSEILEEEKKEKRARLIKKAVVGLAAGAGTSYGMGQALHLDEQVSASNEAIKSSNADMARNDADMVTTKADEAARIQKIDVKAIEGTDERLAEIHKRLEEKFNTPETPIAKPTQVPNIEPKPVHTPTPEPTPIPEKKFELAYTEHDPKIKLSPEARTPEELKEMLGTTYAKNIPFNEHERVYDRPIGTETSKFQPEGLYKYDGVAPKAPEIVPAQIPDARTLEIVRLHPEFVLKNPYVLSSQQLAETYDVHYKNINHLLPNNTAENWREVSQFKVKDLLRSNPAEEGKIWGPIVSYAQRLQTESGLKPEDGFIKKETFEHYAARALQKIEADGHLHKVTLDTPVPKSPDFQHATQTIQPEVKNAAEINTPITAENGIITIKSDRYPLYDSAKVSFEHNSASGKTTGLSFSGEIKGSSGQELTTGNFRQEMTKWATEHNKDQQWEIDKAVLNLRTLYGHLAAYTNISGNPAYTADATYLKNTIEREIKNLSEYGHIIDFSKLPGEFQPPLKQ